LPQRWFSRAAVRRRTGSSQAVQEGGERDGRDLEDAAECRETFRRLDAPELLADVASGVIYINGVRVVNRGDKKVAD